MSNCVKTVKNEGGRTLVTTLDKSQVKRDFTHYIGIFMWIGWAIFYISLLVLFPIFVWHGNMFLSLPMAVILLSALSPIDPKHQPKWGYDIGTWTMKKTAEYCHIKMVVEDFDAVKEASPAIFAFEPHDLLPVSMSCLNDCLEGIPGHKCKGCVSSACFVVPIFRHINVWVNACNADKKQIHRLLDEGYSPVICPGGVQEVLRIESQREVVLYLKNRLGFVRVAMFHGVPIVPIFAFGLKQCFDFTVVPKSSLIARISKRMGFVPMIFYGVWGLPFGPCKPCDLVNIVGRPIAVPHKADASDDEVREYLNKYIEETTRLFETYKEQYGMGEYHLRVI